MTLAEVVKEVLRPRRPMRQTDLVVAMIEAGYDRENPYCVGIVELEDGSRISAQILGVDAAQPERIAIGTLLKVSFIERGTGEQKKTFLAFERD